MKEEEGKVDEAASLIQEVQAGPLQLWRVHKAFLGFMLGGLRFLVPSTRNARQPT